MTPKNILFPVLDAQNCESAYPVVLQFARAHSARVTVLQAVNPCEWSTRIPYGNKQLQPDAFYRRLLDDLRRRCPFSDEEVKVEYVVKEGDPVTLITDFAARSAFDLVVVIGGGASRGLRKWLFRSVSERIAAAAPCPVLFIPTTQLTRRIESQVIDNPRTEQRAAG